MALLLAGLQQYAQNITRLEYWIDGDPGYGQATSIPITQAVNLQNIVSSDVLSLAPGTHILGIRSKDANGRWSQTNTASFRISAIVSPTDVVSIEYFWDGDAGFGQNQIHDLTTSTQNLVNHVFQANVPADFSANNPHILFSRSLDNAGRYSQTNIVDEVVLEPLLSVADFTRAGIEIYPNPVQDELNIRMDADAARLIIYDLNGRKVLDTKINQTDQVHLSHLSAGVYHAYFWKQSDKIHLVKLIKK